MPDNLFIIDIKEFLMNAYEQFRLWFHSQHFGLYETFKPYIFKALKNPLATAITLIALFGIPFTLIKIKKTSTEAGKRLDKLIEELDQYEVNKPKINLKKKPQQDSTEESEALESFSAVDDESHSCPPEPADENDLIVRTLNRPKERLATDSLVALPPLYFKDEATEATDVEQETLSAPQNEEEEEFSFIEPAQKTFSLTGEDDEPDWDQLTEESAGSEVPAASAGSKYEESDFAGLEIQDLQQEMEKTIQKLTRQMSSQDSEEAPDEEAPDVEKVYAVPTLSDFHSIEPQSSAEEIYDNEEPDEPFQETRLESQPQEVLEETTWDEEEPGPTKSDSIVTQLKTFQEKLATRFQPEGGTKIQDSNEPENAKTGETFLKPTGIACSLPSKAKNRDYQELLESLILLNNPRKNS